MSNPYYTHSTYPAPNAPGSSAALRAELELITAGFDKLPTLAANANKVVAVNSLGTALTATTSLTGLTISSSTIGSPTLTGTVSLSGNLSFSFTAQRILGDFSNATLSSRVLFQSSTVNGNSLIGIIPNGSSTNSQVQVFNSSSLTNYSFGSLVANSGQIRVTSAAVGTGTLLPIAFHLGGAEAAQFSTAGNLLLGSTTDDGVNKLQVTGKGTFSSDVTVNAMTVGRGGGGVYGNSAFGVNALVNVSSGGGNTGLGGSTLTAITTGGGNTAVGATARANFNTDGSTAVGYQSLIFSQGNYNTAIGWNSGNALTTGAKNTILGCFTGNQGGLNIAALSNHIVLSDGDGNPRAYIDNSGNLVQTVTATPATLGINMTLTATLTSNTNLRFSARGSDGVTRTANITLS